MPRSLVWRLLFGEVIWIGCLCVALGLLLLLPVALKREPSSSAYDRWATATTTTVEMTSDDDDQDYRVRYTFIDQAGVARSGASYTDARPSAPGSWHVDYRSDDPSESRLRGMHRYLKPAGALFLGLGFVILGLVFVIAAFPRQLRRFWLLRYGTATSGKLVGKAKIDDVDGVPWLELTFEYEVDGTTHVTKALTLRPLPVDDDLREMILYDPRTPARATTLDDVIGPKVLGGSFEYPDSHSTAPAKATVTAGGELEGRPGIAFNLLILPPALVVGLLVVLVMQMI